VATFPGSFIDEAEYAKKVVENIGVAAEYVTIDPSRGIDDIFRQLYLFEELYLTSPVPMMSVYGAIRKGGVVVSIDGHGADELLSGYGKSIYEAFLDSGVNLASIRNILRTFEGLYDTPKFAGVVNIPKQDLLVYLRFLKMRLGAKGAIRHILSELFSHQPKGARGAFNEHLYTLFTKTILPTLLRNYDRYAMANSVEIRMPFMDYRLVEYCFSLPWESKIRNGYTKAILRDSVKDLVPHEVLYRKFKIGFNTPFTEWMQNQWKTFLLDTLENQDFKQSDLIDAPKVDAFIRRVINDPKASFADGEDAWKMLIPYFWEKSFLKADYKS
jgi:asparagine synthase (glutamine-hydrolysing)